MRLCCYKDRFKAFGDSTLIGIGFGILSRRMPFIISKVKNHNLGFTQKRMGKTSFIQRILRNPAMGLLPILVFSFLVGFVNNHVSLAIGLGLSTLGSLIIKKPSRMIYGVSAIAFAISLAFSFIIPGDFDRFRTFAFVEIFFVLSLIVMRLSRAKIIVRLTKNNNPLIKNYWAESFRVAFQSQYGLSIHLLIVLLYFIFESVNSSVFDRFGIILVAQIIIGIIIVGETIRLHILDKKLYKEEWLPVVTEKGDVTGRIAKSVTKDMKNRFMHPVVRVALIYKGRIYLKNRDESRLLNPGMLDYPFEKYMQYDHDIDEAVHNSIRKECGAHNIPLRFLLKYIFENTTTKRLIYLYVSVIEDEETFNRIHLQGGKLWTEAQIEDNMGEGVFSECFELEFEYLKNTVLMIHRLTEQGA